LIFCFGRHLKVLLLNVKTREGATVHVALYELAYGQKSQKKAIDLNLYLSRPETGGQKRRGTIGTVAVENKQSRSHIGKKMMF
jgi:hypothetical protein